MGYYEKIIREHKIVYPENKIKMENRILKNTLRDIYYRLKLIKYRHPLVEDVIDKIEESRVI